MYKIYAKIRDERDLNDYKVAKAVGLRPSVFSDWKHGRYQPKADKIAAIARFLNVPMDTFYPKKIEV